jgi:hypothetical protein
VRRRRSPRAPIVAIATIGALVLVLALPAGAGAASRAAKPSEKACDGFADYFTIEFLVAFASAFAGVGSSSLDGTTSGTGGTGGTGSSISGEEIQDIFHLIFSPKLEAVTALLAHEAPPSIQGLFAKQQAVFTRGIDILEGLGLTKHQLQQLATLDLSPDTDVTKLLGDVKISRAKLRAAGKKFGKDAGALDLNRVVSRTQQRAFQQTGTQCGVFPKSPVKCASLVDAGVAAPLLGGAPVVKAEQGSCTYTGPAEPGADEPVMVVDVYPTPRTFGRFAKQLQNPEKLDADSYLTDGFSSFASSKTCGKTLYSRTTAHTIVVALCPPDGAEVTPAQLEQVRDAAAAALAA